MVAGELRGELACLRGARSAGQTPQVHWLNAISKMCVHYLTNIAKMCVRYCASRAQFWVWRIKYVRLKAPKFVHNYEF